MQRSSFAASSLPVHWKRALRGVEGTVSNKLIMQHMCGMRVNMVQYPLPRLCHVVIHCKCI